MHLGVIVILLFPTQLPLLLLSVVRSLNDPKRRGLGAQTRFKDFGQVMQQVKSLVADQPEELGRTLSGRQR
jgi:hypothetical protein